MKPFLKIERDSYGVYFKLVLDQNSVYLVPFFVGGSSVPTTCGLSCEILRFATEELAAVDEVLLHFSCVITAYYEALTPNYEFNIPPYYLRELLTLELTESEERAVKDHLERLTFIYLIKDNTTGYIKIGRSNNPEERLRTIAKQATLLPTPNDFVLLDYFEAYPILETNLHKKYEAKRIRGEWFDLSEEDVAAILRIQE